MARTNRKAREKKVSEHKDATVNEEGGLAFKVSPERELYLRSASCLMGEPQFYGERGAQDNSLLKLVGAVAKTNPEFVLQLANYCRNEMYLRTLPIALLVEATEYPETKKYVRRYTPHIVRRPDELTEAVAMFKSKKGDIGDHRNSGSLPASLKRGLADTFHNFDEYGFAKYDRDNEVKLSDVIRLVHPKPLNAKESELFKNVRHRTLKTPETWEVNISTRGSTKENWADILPKMGFMARLRNLRNLIEKGVDITPVLDMLKDEKAVAKSKQFPYRFFSAYRVMRDVDGDPALMSDVTDALETALELSVKNIPRVDGTTFVSTDNSGSMTCPMSEKSTVTHQEVGNLMGAMAHHFSDRAIASVFGTYFKAVPLMKKDSILTNMGKLNRTNVEHGTNGWLTIDYLIRDEIFVDRIMLFSDMQCYDTYEKVSWVISDLLNGSPRGWGYGDHGSRSLAASLRQYKKKVNPDVKLYSFNLANYGTSQWPEDESNVYLLSGFSDKVFKFVKAVEDDIDPLDIVANVGKVEDDE